MVFQSSLPLPPSPPKIPMDEILQEIRALRREIEQLRGPSKLPPSRQPCKGVTGKGTPCRNSSQPGHEYCRMHGERPPKEVKPKRVKKEPKPKKIQPEHDHNGGDICLLCETHGDVMDPTLPDATFEGDTDIEERLRKILAE